MRGWTRIWLDISIYFQLRNNIGLSSGLHIYYIYFPKLFIYKKRWNKIFTVSENAKWQRFTKKKGKKNKKFLERTLIPRSIRKHSREKWASWMWTIFTFTCNLLLLLLLRPIHAFPSLHLSSLFLVLFLKTLHYLLVKGSNFVQELALLFQRHQQWLLLGNFGFFFCFRLFILVVGVFF